jgi:hypothetical protein
MPDVRAGDHSTPGLNVQAGHEPGPAMISTAPLARPTLYLNGTRDARWAKALLEKYAIDFEVRHTADPLVCLHWNGTTYTDVFGIADFLMFAGRLSLPGTRTRDRTGDGELPGSRIRLS